LRTEGIKNVPNKKVWLKRHYRDEDYVILWRCSKTYKVESCIRGCEIVSTVLSYDEAITIYDIRISDI
jgi:hypothetical protein